MVDFGDVPVNQEVGGSILVSNSSSVPMMISKMSITGGAFSIASKNDLPMSIPSGSSLPLKVNFTPAATTDYSGQLTVMDRSAFPMAHIQLHGHGSSRGSHGSAQLTLSATSLSFGSIAVNAATTRSLTLTSTGTSPVTVNSATITGTGFAIVGGSLPATLNPQQSVTLQVQFKPVAIGAASGKILIGSSSAISGMIVVALNGTGEAAANPQLTVSSTSLAFGNVTVNTAKALSLVLTSTGTSPVTVNSAVIAGTGFAIVGGSLPATLNPQQSVTLQVQFKPTSAGAATGKITVGSNSTSGSTTGVTLSGTGAAAANPQLTVSSTSLAFGNVTVNTAKALSLVLTSTGTSPVTVNSAAIAGTGFAIVGGSLPATLSPQQSVTLQVQFKPTTAGAATGKVTVSSNSTSGSTATIALSGTGAAATNPQLTVSSTSLAFGNVTVNTAKSLSLVLTSTGTSPVTVNSAAIAGTGFAIVGGSLPATLSPQQSVTLQVQFKPTTAGAATGKVTVSSNSTSGSTATIALSGTGAAATNPQLTVSPTSLAFGSVTVNTAKVVSLVLTSTGTSPVTVNSAAIAGTGFTIVSQTFPATLNPQQSVTLQVQFKPTATGAASGTITVGSNSTSGSTTAVALSGTGAATDPQLTVSSMSLSFGSIAVNTATTLSITLKSTGTTPVTVNSAAITGAGFSTIGGSFPVTLNPSGTATIQVQFKPTTAGAVTGKLTISSNSGSGSTVAVSLSGTGTATAHQVDLSWTAPSSTPDPVKGYNVYRSTGSGAMTLMNSSINTTTSYVDSSVASGTSYNYVVKSVGTSGVESVGSNQIEVAVP